MAQGVDYSWGRPDPGCLASWGYTFVGRYVALGSTEKLLSSVEARIAIANGLQIVSIGEAGERDALGGYDVGYSHAQQCYAWARLVGADEDRPVYLVADWDVRPYEYDTVQSYLDGAAAAIGREKVGLYGGFYLVEAMAQRGAALWFMQTSSWSYGQWSVYAHIQQYDHGVTVCGADTDLDRSTTLDFGQWGQPFPAYVAPDVAQAVDTSGLPDVREDGPWDYTPHIGALSDTFADAASSLYDIASAVDDLRS